LAIALVSAALLGLAGASPAQATVVNCIGVGTTLGGAVQYGNCPTDQTGGSGSVVFERGGLRVHLKAQAQAGPEQVASFWESNGPVAAGTTGICVTVNVSQLALRGHATAEQTMQLSYDSNGIVIRNLVWGAGKGVQQYCGSVPVGSSNIWWELLTTVGGSSSTGHGSLTQTITGVTLT